jgi:hypothetical protein
MECDSVFHQLVSHNEDIRALLEKGYAVAFDSCYLIIRDIPYLDQNGTLQMGAIVTKFVSQDNKKIAPEDHQIFFAGGVPHNLDGQAIPNLGGGPHQLPLGDSSKDVLVQRSFSNKPKVKGQFQDFKDLFEKIESYVGIICGPAIERYNVTPFTFRAIRDIVPDTIFKFHDTLTSRAEITDLRAKFRDDVVAIIGLGGTGGYVLDFLVKTPVREIRAFDFDPFYIHNSYRAPGKIDESDFGRLKTNVCRGRHESFRHGLSVINKRIDRNSADDMNGVTFAFVCVDKGSSRSEIFDLLLEKKIPFIDVGMGLKRKNGSLGGMLRTTYFSADDGQRVRDKNLVELSDSPENIYRANIQIGELNALNACLAIIRFKQLRGFYVEENPNYNLLFDVSDLKIVGESNLE